MKYRVFGVGVVCLALVACQTTPLPSSVSTAVTIVCGVMNVVVEASVSEQISENFGPGSLADKACELFVPSGSALPAPGTGPTTVSATLPDGQSVTATIERVR